MAQPGGKAVTYTLEAAGRRQAMIDPDGGRTTYSYDGANRVTSLLNPFAERTTYGFDALGGATTITLANGAVTTATFDAAGRQTGMRHSKNGTQLQSFAYSYDNSGRRTGVVEGGGDRVTWTYDLAGKLTREQRSGTNAYDITYAYDPMGNRLTMLTGGVTTTYSYNAGDELTVANEGGTLTTYSYDANGNTTGENAAGSLTTYAWDDENRLKVLTPSSGDPATMTYDATGLRRTRAVGAATTRFIWDGQKVLLETDAGGTTQAQFTLNLGTYGDLISQRRSSTSRWYHFDALGSTDRLTGADGTATDTYTYKAFGPLAASTGSSTNPFRYVGKLGYYDQGSGPLYVRARWLRPTTGSWLSVDPTGGGGTHEYAGAAPTWLPDPSGMDTDWWLFYGKLRFAAAVAKCIEDCGGWPPPGGIDADYIECVGRCMRMKGQFWSLQLRALGWAIRYWSEHAVECAGHENLGPPGSAIENFQNVCHQLVPGAPVQGPDAPYCAKMVWHCMFRARAGKLLLSWDVGADYPSYYPPVPNDEGYSYAHAYSFCQWARQNSCLHCRSRAAGEDAYDPDYQPRPGDLLIHGDCSSPAQAAHIGFVLFNFDTDNEIIWTLEGNVCVDPQGWRRPPGSTPYEGIAVDWQHPRWDPGRPGHPGVGCYISPDECFAHQGPPPLGWFQ